MGVISIALMYENGPSTQRSFAMEDLKLDYTKGHKGNYTKCIYTQIVQKERKKENEKKKSHFLIQFYNILKVTKYLFKIFACVHTSLAR